MRISFFFLALLVRHVSVCLSRSIPSSHTVHEKRDHHPHGWVRRGMLRPDALVPIRVGLTQKDLHLGHEYVMDVSHPRSSEYGKHWTAQQVNEAFAPTEETFKSVSEWLISSGISRSRISHSSNKGWLTIEATVKEVEELLHTFYHIYHHSESGETAAACNVYHVPKDVQKHIDYISPGTQLHQPKSGFKSRSKQNLVRNYREDQIKAGPAKLNRRTIPITRSFDPQALDTCDIVTTPACVRALYGVPTAHTATSGNTLGIFEDYTSYAQEDLNSLFTYLELDIPNGTHPELASIDGGEAPTRQDLASPETSLDLTIAYPLIYPQQITLFQNGDLSNMTSNAPDDIGLFLDAIDGSYCNYSAFGETGDDPSINPVYPDSEPGGYHGQRQCGTHTLTNVLSISYGGAAYQLPLRYKLRQCNEFMKLALRGYTVLVSSGDTGVTYPGKNGTESCLGPNNAFIPTWPATCPYITAVGATRLWPGQKVSEPESAAIFDKPNNATADKFSYLFSSGGGFSSDFQAPEYQRQAIERYFREGFPPYPYWSGDESFGAHKGRYWRDGRGYPDVSAAGSNFAMWWRGKLHLDGSGTSASAPVFASIINLINEERLAVGKRPVGFLNPVLYENPHVLNDIKYGSNPGCGTGGFEAVSGWDPVTGLGTPDYPKMLDLFMSLP